MFAYLYAYAYICRREWIIIHEEENEERKATDIAHAHC